MRLFAADGFKGTSVTRIEKAAGLSPGAGGIYRHFTSKEQILREGIRRHLDRLEALRAVRQLFGESGPLRDELAVAARYQLDELDGQSELLKILAAECRSRPELLSAAVEELITGTYRGFAEWLQDLSPGLDARRASTIANLALGSLLSSRLLHHVLGVRGTAPSDDDLVEAWVDMVEGLLPA